ncbi:MAG: hypothetical protein FWC38_09590 [Proteobacteria bacterium]|nr:hypothetical protein [Pseudomonadota bacterium]
MSEVRSQRSEVRGQRSEVRGQKSEVRSQRSEVRGQRSEVRSQKSEVRSQRSEVRGQKTISREGVCCGRQVAAPTPQSVRFARGGSNLLPVTVQKAPSPPTPLPRGERGEPSPRLRVSWFLWVLRFRGFA